LIFTIDSCLSVKQIFFVTISCPQESFCTPFIYQMIHCHLKTQWFRLFQKRTLLYQYTLFWNSAPVQAVNWALLIVWSGAQFQNRTYWNSSVLFWDKQKHRVFKCYLLTVYHLVDERHIRHFIHFIWHLKVFYLNTFFMSSMNAAGIHLALLLLLCCCCCCLRRRKHTNKKT
jgi:hypothetical protein